METHLNGSLFYHIYKHKLMSFLFEDEDQDQNSKGLRRSKEVILSTKDTPIEQVEDALLDLSNYGQYVPYQ